jgi:outer membrane protein OmpA-like peptidoglycan-associated protein
MGISMSTRAVFGLTAATLLAACSGGPAPTAAPAPAPAVAAARAPAIAGAPNTAVSLVAFPAPGAIGSPKFGVTSDCNAMSGGTVQGRTSATTMLDCGPVVEAVASPPPPPRPVALQTFTTCFDLDRADITPDGRRIIEQAAANARAGNASRITVVGHADTSGSSVHNDRLSAQRAEAVRQALIAAGVPAGAIEARGVGETNLAVPTPDQMREPRNRCVVISPERAST